MKIKRVLPAYIFLVLFCSCQSQKKDLSTISLHPSDLEIYSGPLEDILEIEKIVTLETNPDALLGDIMGFAQSESGILIRNQGNKSFFIYEEDGSFRTKIAKEGKGPGEYVAAYGQDWIPTENNEKDEIVISDIYGKKVLFFSSDGEFISEAKIPYRIHNVASVSPNYILCHHGRFPFRGKNSEIPCELIVLDREGTEIKKFFPYAEPLLFELATGFSQGINSSGITYFKQLDPTIYHINQELMLDTLWKFDFGNLNPDTSYLLVPGAEGGERVGKTLETNPFLYLGRMVQNNNTLMVSHFFKKTQHNIFINNKSRNTMTIKADSISQIGDWNSLPVQIPEWSYKESFVYDLSAIDWREMLHGLDKETKAYMRKELPGFEKAEQVKENDNPVLVYFKLKDF